MRLSLLSLLLAAATGAFAADESDVLELNATNFDSTVNPADLILVEFFAPWCGHCKNLAPHYEEAATALKAKGIPIAKVDCVDQSELCQTHGVSGYPTLKVFRKGTPSEYTGPRKADGIISYMVKQSLPAVTTVTADKHEEFTKADKVVAILYATEASEAPAPVFSKVAEKHRDDYLFGIVTDSAVAQTAGVTPPALVIYRSFDEPRTNFPSGQITGADEAKVASWLKELSIPVIDEVSGENYGLYADSGLPLAYVFLDPTKEGKEELVESFKPLAKTYKGKINFVWIDGVKFAEHGKMMNLQEAKWPAFVIQDIEKQLKYPFDQAAAFNVEDITTFVKKYSEGKVEPSLRSQAIPEVQDEPSFTLVTKQFDEVVFDDSKDVLVEFYAPWCGHCKRLKPTWDDLASKFAPVKDKLLIAKMDATENDIPPSAPFRVNGFPTIKFKPAGSREFVDYEGDRSLESFVEFIYSKAKNTIPSPLPEAPKETAATSEASPAVTATEAVPQGEKPAQTHVEL